jgi:hypothetical protein
LDHYRVVIKFYCSNLGTKEAIKNALKHVLAPFVTIKVVSITLIDESQESGSGI